MAKKKKSRRKGVGSVIQVRQLSGVGLGKLGQANTVMGSAMPVLIGGGVALATTLGVRSYVKPDSESNIKLIDNAPWLGIGAGVLGSLALWNMTSQQAGVAAGVSALLVGGGFLAKAMLDKSAAEAALAPVAASAAPAGLRAIVPEYSMRGLGGGQGLGMIAMEPAASRGYGTPNLGSYGEEVNLGAVNVNAFGTPGFQLGGRYR